jgi:putative CocE/NonD family hydrolase
LYYTFLSHECRKLKPNQPNQIMKHFFSTIILIFLFNGTARSQDITGKWHGIADFEDSLWRIDITIDTINTGFKAIFDFPDYDFLDNPADTTIVKENSIDIKFGNQAFKGLISKDATQLIGVWSYPGNAEPIEFGREKLNPIPGSLELITSTYSKEETLIEMRDGINLFTSIYTPKDRTEKNPILLVRTPYNIEPDKDSYSPRLVDLYHLTDENYIIVFQDVRGRYMSEGKFVDVRPYRPDKKRKEIDENSDTYDTIDWLVKNVPNNNGNVGIFGISYPGFYSTMALPNAHPALKAASPQAPVTNWFIGDDWHHNGAFFLMDAFSFYSSVGQLRKEPTRKGPAPFDFKNKDNYDFYRDIGPLKNVAQKYFGDSIQFWSDLMSHPNYDSFWKERDVTQHLSDVKPAVFVVGGWFDAEDLYGPLQTYEAIESLNKVNQNRLIMGPWFHGQWSDAKATKLGNIHFDSNTATYFKEKELAFFDYYLKDKGTMDLAEATIFVTGSNQWMEFGDWPPSEAETMSLYLDCNETLSFKASTENDCYEEYIADPAKPVPYTEDVHLRRTREYLTDDQRFASRRPDVMVYQTEILKEDITLVGPIDVNFYVSTSGTDADYVVKIIDVFPDELNDYPKNSKDVPMAGYQMLVRGEVLRGRFRNSFETPEPFIPNETTNVSFEIPDTAHQFKKGHRIMIQVQNSWFPLVDINPQTFVNIYTAEEKDFIKSTHRIYHDAERPSNISFGVLKK